MKKGMKTAMKSMRRKAMKVSKIAKGRFSKVLVLRGSKAKTVGGLKATDLKKNKHGRVVSKKQSARGSKNKWMVAVARARKELGVKGFHAVGGKSAKGQALYKKAKSFYKK